MIVCIPSIGRSPFFTDLLNVLVQEPYVSEIWIIDNSEIREDWWNYPAYQAICNAGPRVETALDEGRIWYQHKPGQTIYAAWNQAIDRGTELNEPIALLNDDIVLPMGSLQAAARHIPRYAAVGLNYFDPDGPVNINFATRPANGTYRTGGIGCFAFVVAPGVPHVHEGFEWWYGDDDLLERIKAQGGQLAVALGAPVGHPRPSTTGNQMSWTAEATGRDAALFQSLWG